MLKFARNTKSGTDNIVPPYFYLPLTNPSYHPLSHYPNTLSDFHIYPNDILNYSGISLDPTLINDLKLIPLNKTLTLENKPELFCSVIWIINSVITLNNNFNFELSDSEGSSHSGARLKDYILAKKLLKETEYISTSYHPTQSMNSYGEIVFHGKTKYKKGEMLDGFDYEKSDAPTIINIPPFDPLKLRYISKGKDNSNKSPSLKFKNEGVFPISITRHIFLPHDDMFESIEQKYLELTGKTKIRPDDKAYRGIYLFLDDLRRRYPNLKVEYILKTSTISDNMSPLNAHKIPTTYLQKLFGDVGIPVSRKTVTKTKKVLLGIQHSPKKNDSDFKGLGWVKIDKNYQNTNNGRCDDFRLTDKFFNGRETGYGSSKSYEIKQDLTTRFKVLADCSLSSNVFKVFDSIAIKKGWNEDSKKIEKTKLDNFSHLKGIFIESKITDRVYTHIVSIPKDFRDYILIDDKETVEIDIKTAHALFLAHTKEFKNHPKEREEWLNLIQNDDIYNHVIELMIPHMTLTEREDFLNLKNKRSIIKPIFNAYLNGGGKKAFDGEYKFEYNFSYVMRTHFPVVDQVINQLCQPVSLGGYTVDKADFDWTTKYMKLSGRRNGVALKLQEIESDIMGTHFMCNSNYECISIYDGLLVKKSEAKKIIKAVKSRAKRILGFDITVEEK